MMLRLRLSSAAASAAAKAGQPRRAWSTLSLSGGGGLGGPRVVASAGRVSGGGGGGEHAVVLLLSRREAKEDPLAGAVDAASSPALAGAAGGGVDATGVLRRGVLGHSKRAELHGPGGSSLTALAADAPEGEPPALALQRAVRKAMDAPTAASAPRVSIVLPRDAGLPPAEALRLAAAEVALSHATRSKGKRRLFAPGARETAEGDALAARRTKDAADADADAGAAAEKDGAALAEVELVLAGEPALPEGAAEALRLAEADAEGQALAAALTRMRADEADPQHLEECARALAESSGGLAEVRVDDAAALEADGLHLLRAVGRAATCPPRLITLHYRGAGVPEDAPVTALVGKGITFDSGGLDLKTGGSMLGMDRDMAGAAAVLGAFRTAVRAGLPVNLVAAVPAAENAASAESYKPGMVVPTARGLVMVTNTDAEGRLALADAFEAVQRRHRPATMVDVATLTGACKMALGHRAGVFARPRDGALANELVECGDAAGELSWRMPLDSEHRDPLRAPYSDVAILSSGAPGRGGSTAASFLQFFVDPAVRWAHMDIAGASDHSFRGHGFGASLLVRFMEREAASGATASK